MAQGVKGVPGSLLKISVNCLGALILRFIAVFLTVKVRVYSLDEELQPAGRETVLTFVVSCIEFNINIL